MKGMGTFTWLWSGQLLATFGTAMTRFALTIWAFNRTGQVTTLALLGFFNSGAYVLFSPMAGVLVDRWPRKWVIVAADAATALVTAGLLGLFAAGQLEIWHVYVAGVLSNALGAFQEPAFRASVSVLVPKTQLTRANAMLSLADDGSRMFAPMLAGVLLLVVSAGGIMAVDVITCLLAAVSVLVNRIPQPKASAEGKAARGGWAHELTFGFRYIAQRPGLLGILVIFTVVNLFAALTYYGVLSAMILARSGHSQVALGTVQSMLGVGGVVGGVLLSVWGGPRRRLPAFLLTTAASFALGDMLLAVGRTLPAWAVAAFFSSVFIPFILSCYESIWQAQVAHDIQGRVLAAKNMVQVGSMPIGYLAAGILADRVFEPAMAAGGRLAGTFGNLVGTGPGAGMGLMFACTCVLGLATSLSGFLFPAIRHVEHEAGGPAQAVAARSPAD